MNTPTPLSNPLGFQPLPVLRLYFEASPRQSLQLPAYAGSMLRGAFGHSFRKLSCMTRQPTCNQCPLLATCPYSQIFETPAIPANTSQVHTPRPYAIEPPNNRHRQQPAGSTFQFAMVLIGKAIHQLPLIILAWEQALKDGLGKHKQACDLLCVHMGNPQAPVYRPGYPLQPIPDIHHPSLNWHNRRQIVLRIHTPLRLQQNGRLVGTRELNARNLLVTLARRQQRLSAAYQPDSSGPDFRALTQAASQIQLEQRLHWFDWERYSNRQQQSMTLGGLIGELQLTGELEPFAPLLEQGQWLHVGKETTFGLGHYQLQTHWSSPTIHNTEPGLSSINRLEAES